MAENKKCLHGLLYVPEETAWASWLDCCRPCMEEECRAGRHCWDPVALGPGVAEFVCDVCGAASGGTLKPLERLGFKPL